jgi:O-antigen/teichoic acid export membrane protein
MVDHGWIRPSPERVTDASTVAAAVSTKQNQAAAENSSRKYIRGSSLLLLGRVVSVLLNLAVQVLTVRYLVKTDYGAFAYALAVVSMGSSAIQVGLGKAIPRLVPIYYERKDYSKTFGSIALASATIWGLGISMVALLFGFQGVVQGRVVTDPQSLSLLLILIVLAPIGAYTTLLEKLVAVFARPRDIFFRRHVLGPGLKLAAVSVVVLTAGDVYLLAYGYLAGGLIGVWLYVTILIREWRRQGLLGYLHPSRYRLPARELFGFSFPMFSSQLSLILRGSVVVILLEHYHATTAVAEFRAVLPVAGLNMVVYEAFYLLFVPVASRMFARDELAGISELYWRTSVWIMVLSFPVLLVTCALATPLTVLLFGADYANAGLILALLAFGHYFNAALGFNSAALRVHGKLSLIVLSDVLAGIATIALCLLLIPSYGALGAALATSGTFILHNAFNQISLVVGSTGIRLLEPRFVRIFASAMLIVGALLIAQWLFSLPTYVSFGLAVGVSLLFVRMTRKVLDPAATYPELMRIPLVRQFLT